VVAASGLTRVLTLRCADWPVVAAVRCGALAPGAPAFVLDGERVVAADALARAAGVRVGQRRRAARRAAPDATVVVRDHLAEARAFEPVVQAVGDLCPRLEVIDAGWLALDIRGPARHFGGEQAFVAHLAGVVAHLVEGARSGIGLADGRAASAIASLMAARDAAPVIVAAGGSTTFLGPLDLAWFRAVGEVDAETVDLLHRLGIRTAGDLAALDHADVLTRFGAAGARLHAVVSGDDRRRLHTVDPARLPEVTHPFDEPVATVTPVVFAARRLAADLVGALAASGTVCTRVTVIAETEHSERSERHWYRAEGLSVAAIVERVRWQLDAWIGTVGAVTAGITLITLIASEARPDEGAQAGLWGGRTAADETAARAVTRLVAMCGEEAVRVPVWVGGRLPAQRYGWLPAADVDLGDGGSRTVADGAPWPGSLTRPAPATLPVEPEVAEVLDADGVPVLVSGRGEVTADPALVVAGGRPAGVVAWAGPWPIVERWWEQRRRRLAHLQVVLDDGRALLLAVERRRWTVVARHD
jgi:protein ImuB